MEKKKLFFESFSSLVDTSFLTCIPAFGQGSRKSWGRKNEERKRTISLLKEKNPQWKQLCSNSFNAAFFSRKIRKNIENRQELEVFIKNNISILNSFEKNWVYKIYRSLQKSELTLKKQKEKKTEVYKIGKLNSNYPHFNTNWSNFLSR